MGSHNISKWLIALDRESATQKAKTLEQGKSPRGRKSREPAAKRRREGRDGNLAGRRKLTYWNEHIGAEGRVEPSDNIKCSDY